MFSPVWILGLLYSIVHVEGLAEYPHMRLCPVPNRQKGETDRVSVEFMIKSPSSDSELSEMITTATLKTEDIKSALAKLGETDEKRDAVDSFNGFLNFNAREGFYSNYLTVDAARAPDGSALGHWEKVDRFNYRCLETLAPGPAHLVNRICAAQISAKITPEVGYSPS